MIKSKAPQPGPSDAVASDAAASDELLTPRECRKATETPKWAHAAASALHGWHDHHHHSLGQQPFRMTRDVYLEAVKAATSKPTTKKIESADGKRFRFETKLVPCEAALSEYARFNGSKR